MASSTLSAHAAFFVDDAPRPDLGSLLEWGPLLAIAGGVALALVTWTIASVCADPRRERCAIRWLSEIASGLLSTVTSCVPVVARVALGVALLWSTAIGTVATPNLVLDGSAADVARVLSVVVGAALLLGVRVRAAAVATIAGVVVAAYAAGAPIVVLERLDIVGLALFVAVLGGRRLEPRMDDATLGRLQLGTAWLRALVAGGLLTVAVTEKLANVPMTAEVLRTHPRVDLGLVLGTDAATTVLLLGAVEVAFAVLVLLLPLPELLALAIGAPFVLSVGEFGLLEVPGHVPVWGAVAVLALLGAHVQTADLVTVRPPWMRHVRRTPDAARVRVVGARVPWVTDARPTTIHVGSVAPLPGVSTVAPLAPIAVAPAVTMPATAVPAVPAVATRVTTPARSIPAAPSLAPQVAAWLGRTEPPASIAAPTARPMQAAPAPVDPAVVEPPRFAWATAPGAGNGSA